MFNLPELDSLSAVESNSAAVTLLKQILMDSLEREQGVTGFIEAMCEQHAGLLKKHQKEMKRYKEGMSEQVEALMMRNEELETRLL